MRGIAAASVACSLLSACTGSIPVRLSEWADPHISTADRRAITIEAGELLGYPIEFQRTGYGAITLTIVEGIVDSFRGQNDDRNGCDRSAIAEPDPVVVAHELAHALNLDHVCEYPDSPKFIEGETLECGPQHMGSLMHPSVLGLDLTEREQRRMALAVSNLNACGGR